MTAATNTTANTNALKPAQEFSAIVKNLPLLCENLGTRQLQWPAAVVAAEQTGRLTRIGRSLAKAWGGAAALIPEMENGLREVLGLKVQADPERKALRTPLAKAAAAYMKAFYAGDVSEVVWPTAVDAAVIADLKKRLEAMHAARAGGYEPDSVLMAYYVGAEYDNGRVPPVIEQKAKAPAKKAPKAAPAPAKKSGLTARLKKSAPAAEVVETADGDDWDTPPAAAAKPARKAKAVAEVTDVVAKPAKKSIPAPKAKPAKAEEAAAPAKKRGPFAGQKNASSQGTAKRPAAIVALGL